LSETERSVAAGLGPGEQAPAEPSSPPAPLVSGAQQPSTHETSAVQPSAPAVEPAPASAAELAARQRLLSERYQRQAAAAFATGAGRNQCRPTTCTPVRPHDSLIVDFEDVADDGVFLDGDAYSKKPSDWWLNFYGSTYVYPVGDPGLHQVSQGRWHVQGTVSHHSGFGLWLGACVVDFSEYRGLSFELWGDVGKSRKLTLHMDTHEDSPAEACRTNVGGCRPEAGPCVSPSKRISVPHEPGAPIVVLWEELVGGKPRRTPDPSAIIQWHWSFDWDEGTEEYPVEVFVDNVRLVP